MWLVPDKAREVLSPSLLNRGTVYFGFLGYVSGVMHNGISRYPLLRAGVHRQILFTTIGVFIGFHLNKYEKFKYAKQDHELFEYIRWHPEILSHKEKVTMAEVWEQFDPVR